MTGVVLVNPRVKFTNSVGVPLAFGWLTVYQAGTTTLINSWQDKALTTLNTNPIHLDANGECLLWVDSAQTYKLLLQDSSLATVSGWPVDNIPGAADTGAAVSAASAAAAASATAAATSAASALASSNTATTASATVFAYPNSAASNVPRGLTQASVGAITAGSGGTNGTFALSWSAGNFSINPTGTFTVAGGVVTAVTITGPGLYIGASPTVPTPSFAASSGLTGAAVALTAQFLVTSGQGYWVQSSDSKSLLRYKNVSGVATADATVGPVPTTVGVGSFATSSVAASMGTVNVFDATAIADNQILPNGGAPGAFAGYMVTPFMYVKPGDYITFNANGATASWGIQFYDFNQTYISTGGAITANTPIAVPANACFARASFDKTVITAAKLIVVQGQTMLSEYQPFGITSPANNLRLARRVASVYRANVKRNLVDFNNLTSGFFIDGSNASFTPNTDWSLTGYIPVTPGGTITVAPSMPSNVGVNWYDYNQTFISVTSGPFTDGQALSVPSNAFFIRASYLTVTLASPSAVLLLEGTQTHQNAYYHNAVMQSDLRPWLGKGWLVQGTSIDVNVNWFATPAATHGANLTNVARSSRDSSHNLYLADNVTLLQASDFTNIDMVYLNTFTNDAAANMTIGTSADSAATASVWGYTRNFFETILGYKPAMRFVLGTPLQRFDGGLGAWPYSKMLAYAQAVRDIGAFWGAPVLDLYSLSGFNKTTALSGAPAALTIDGVHPTTAGYNQGLIKPATAFFYNCLPVA